MGGDRPRNKLPSSMGHLPSYKIFLGYTAACRACWLSRCCRLASSSELRMLAHVGYEELRAAMQCHMPQSSATCHKAHTCIVAVMDQLWWCGWQAVPALIALVYAQTHT